MSSLAPTFLASLRAVGTAATMAGAGFYLHRRGFVTPGGKKMMALLSQQVTIPAFLFAKIIYCPNNHNGDSSTSGGAGIDTTHYNNFTERDLTEFSDAELDLDFLLSNPFSEGSDFFPQSKPHREIVCPSVADRIADLWMLLIWPFFVVSCGLLTGWMAAKISNTPPVQSRSCMAACAFGNSTGLVMTLLTVIHGQFGSETELGRIDPTAFLSVYLLLYPVLQWGVGGWLLAPEEKSESSDEAKHKLDQVESGISMVTKKGDQTKEFSSSALISYADGSSPTRFGVGADANHPLLVQKNGTGPHPSHEERNGPKRRHGRQHSFHISHLLNHDSLVSFSPAIDAGDEEFGGVPARRLVISSPNHRRHFTTGRIDSSNSMFATLVPDWSSNSLSNLVQDLDKSPSSSPAPRRKASKDKDICSKKDSYHKNAPSFLQQNQDGDDGPLMVDAPGHSPSFESLPKSSSTNSTNSSNKDVVPQTIHENIPLLASSNYNSYVKDDKTSNGFANNDAIQRQAETSEMELDDVPFADTLVRIARKVFQPPVIGALAGLFIASFPNVRGLFVNIWGVTNDDGSGLGKAAPLQWIFDGIHSVGEAAVPINMTILGINLSSTFQKKKKKIESGADDSGNDDDSKSKLLPNETMLAVVVGKMLVMPAIGILSTWMLQKYYTVFPDEIDATCYLVMMIVFITPTANNVMVMVELSGSSSKEGMARLIGWQYAVSPVLLSCVLSAVVSLASGHFDAA